MGNTPSCGKRVVVVQLVYPTRKEQLSFMPRGMSEIVLPPGPMFQDRQQLAHAGRKRHFLRLTGSAEALVERPNGRMSGSEGGVKRLD